jgi:S1-C subfamily serine protease
MSSEYSRREGLGLLGAAGVGSVAISGRAAGLADGGAPPLARNLEEECDRLAALEAEYEELQASTKTLATEIERIEGRLVQERARYPESVRDHAREVGLSIRDSVAFLDMDDGHGSGGEATGWFVEPDLVMTNRHNVEHVDSGWDLGGWLPDGRSFEWEILDVADPFGPDVAVLAADQSFDPIPVASGSVSTGDHLVQVGHPGGAGTWIISLGEVHSVGGETITIDVPGLQGVSGSPVVNLDGEAVGVTFGADVDASASDPPQPEPPEVHHESLFPTSASLHVTIDAAMDLLEGWT